MILLYRFLLDNAAQTRRNAAISGVALTASQLTTRIRCFIAS